MMLAMHIILCFALAWTCWCRIIKTGRNTRVSIRLSFAWGVTSSLLLAAAPGLHLVWAWWPVFQPHLAVIGLLVCVIWWQWATARHWKGGTPRSFKVEVEP